VACLRGVPLASLLSQARRWAVMASQHISDTRLLSHSISDTPLFILSKTRKVTGVPVHTRRILLPNAATRALTVCSQCTGVPVHTRRIFLTNVATRSLAVCSE